MPRTYGFRNGPSTGSGRRYGFGRPGAAAALVLRPQRQGASEQSLRDTVGTRTDSGSPLYRYTDLAVDPGVLAGATVGVPYLYDSVSGGPVGTTYGKPGLLRDGPLEGFGAADYVAVGLGTACMLVVLTTTDWSLNRGVIDAEVGWAGVRIIPVGDTINIRLYTAAGAVSGAVNIVLTSANLDNKSVSIFVTVSAGTLSGYAWSNGTYLGTASTAVTAPPGPWLQTLGVRQDGITNYYRDKIARVASWSSTLTLTQMGEVVAGTSNHSPTLDARGLRTGVNLPGDLTRLIYSEGAGLPVLATAGT